jgi:tetratricopeptide (TPR) repeat protein
MTKLFVAAAPPTSETSAVSELVKIILEIKTQWHLAAFAIAALLILFGLFLRRPNKTTRNVVWGCAGAITLLGAIAFVVPPAPPVAEIPISQLVLQVSTLENQPLKGVVLTTKGDGRTGPPTDDAGKTRIGLAPGTKPGSPVTLVVVKSPLSKPVFVSPRYGTAPVPDSKSFLGVWLAEYGDQAIAKNLKVLEPIPTRIATSIPERTSRRESADQARQRILREQSDAFGLQPADLDRAVRELSQRADPYQRALAALYEDRYEDAARNLRAAVQIVEPNLADKYVALGWAEYQRRDYEAAQKAFEKALVLRLDDPVIHEALAFVLRSRHKFGQARVHMEKAAALGPPTAGTFYGLAILQKNDRRLDLALASLEKAQSLSAAGWERVNIQLVIAGYLIHAGRRDEGLRRFASLQGQMVPPDAFVVNRAWFYAVADRKQDFYDALETALKVRPRETLIWIDQEVDVDKYREEARFKELVSRYEKR